ncbi:methionine adenosyltransferase 2 subunit beta-like [Symsagittifera roscoffensis]|uniref:methionine adenosyltransferase 2 subunit beta-like n=1 Tax=Symsagittifera roscoffensis TaxID=84072 RepID=UPI00307BD390
MKVLLTGASGLLGRAVMAKFIKNNFEIIGMAFSRASSPLHKVNLLENEAVIKFVMTHKPDIIIHSAAERRPEEVQKNPEKSKQLNVNSTDNIASICAASNISLIYISTDYVFDGTNAPYEVNSKPNPINTYGELKLAGEECVKAKEGLKWCILRVPVLFGRTEDLDESAVTILMKALKLSFLEKQMCKMNHIEKRYPTFCDDVAMFLLEISNYLAEKPEGLGVLHFSGNECMTKFEMVQRMARLKQISLDYIEPETVVSTAVKRPYDCHLSMEKNELKLSIQQTPFDDAMSLLLG